MDVYDTIYAVLDANQGKIGGRTAIQKLVYLAHERIPELDVAQYIPHYYGPFSPDLRVALEKMVSFLFVYEARIPGRSYDGYRYGLTDDGKIISRQSKEGNEDMFKKIAETIAICKEFCDLKTAPLSYASKIRYLLNTRGKEGMSLDGAMEYAGQLGWNVSKDNVKQGADLLEKLNLAKSL